MSVWARAPLAAAAFLAAAACVSASAEARPSPPLGAAAVPPRGPAAARRPIAVVAHPDLSRDQMRKALGGDVTFFSESDMQSIRAFSARGGRIVVAYSGDEALGQFMGVKPGKWCKLDCRALGLGGRIQCSYRTGCAFVPTIPKGNPRHARVVSTIYDSSLRDTGLAGAIETDRGIWYAHAVPPPAMSPGAVRRLPGAMRTRGVWTSGHPLDPGGWPSMAKRLVAAGFNTVFIKSDAPEFDEAMKACRKAGLSVHAWMVVFGSTNRSPERKKDVDSAALEALRLVARGVDGIQFDYVRYPSGSGGNRELAARRMRTVSAAMTRICRAVRARSRNVVLSAAVYPVPRSQQSVGQNASEWIRLRLVDFVSPMCYTESDAEFGVWLAENAAAIPASQMVVGIGNGANESRLDANGVKRQVDVAFSRKLRGVALFSLDAELAARLPPAK